VGFRRPGAQQLKSGVFGGPFFLACSTGPAKFCAQLLQRVMMPGGVFFATVFVYRITVASRYSGSGAARRFTVVMPEEAVASIEQHIEQ